MGVLACDRLGCENVMCNRLSHEHGYICNECFNELVQLGADTHTAMFMESLRDAEVNTEASYARFNIEFRYIHDEN